MSLSILPVTDEDVFGLRGDATLAIDDTELYRDAARIDRVKLRYRSDPVACTVSAGLAAGEYPRIELVLSEPFLAAAPGQVACLLAGDRVAGHGVIAERETAHAA